MLLDEQENAFAVLVRKAQARQEPFREGAACLWVSAEVADALLVHGLAGRLAAVVEQHRPPEARLGRHLTDRAHGVLPHIVQVVRILLLTALHGRKLGQGRGDEVGVSHQCALHIAAAQQTGQLLADALGGNAVQAMHLPPHGSGGFRLDGKTQLGREPQSAQDAQRVLLKSGVCITDSTQNTVFEVGLPAERVAQTAFRVPRHRTDREIPAGQILTDVGDKAHAVRMPSVRVAALRAVGGNLERAAVREYGQRAVPESGGEHTRVREHSLHLRRRGGRTQVPVVRFDSAQAVAHAAADRPRLKSGTL